MRWKWTSMRRGEGISHSCLKRRRCRALCRRPREGGDPYVVSSRCGMADEISKARAVVWVPAFAGTTSERASDHSRQPKQLLCIAIADLLLVTLRQTDRVEHLDGVADVARSLLLVERAVGRK